METFAGTTSQDLAVWKRDDKMLFGLLLDASDSHSHFDQGGCAFVGLLPKGTPIAKFEASAFEGHYECILGVNSIHLPVAAVEGKPLVATDVDAHATVARKRTARQR